MPVKRGRVPMHPRFTWYAENLHEDQTTAGAVRLDPVGEMIAVALMAAASNFLARQLRCTVPRQDLRIGERGLPALLRRRFVMSGLRLVD